MRVLDNATWRQDANCLGVDPSVFFPDRGDVAMDAKAICRACEVRTQCLDDAIANREFFGVHGGLSEQEKRKLRRARAREQSVA